MLGLMGYGGLPGGPGRRALRPGILTGVLEATGRDPQVKTPAPGLETGSHPKKRRRHGQLAPTLPRHAPAPRHQPAHGAATQRELRRDRGKGKLADLSMALAGRFTAHHALLCRLHLDRIAVFDDAVGGLDKQIAGKAGRWQRETGLLTSVPGFGDVVAQAWLGEIGPAPHRHFATHEKLACWVTLCPGNNISARKRKHGRTGNAGTYIKPMLIQAAWAAIRVRAGCRPGTTGWSAGSAGPRTRRPRRRRSPRSRTPCSRSPTRCSRAGCRTRSQARTSTPAANPLSRSRPG